MLRWVCLHATKYSSSNTSDFIFPLFDGLSRCHQQDLSLPWFASANFWKSAYLFSFFQKPLIGIACLTTTSLICLHLVEMFSLPTLTSLAVLGGVGAECVKLMKGNIVIRWKKNKHIKAWEENVLCRRVKPYFSHRRYKSSIWAFLSSSFVILFPLCFCQSGTSALCCCQDFFACAESLWPS